MSLIAGLFPLSLGGFGIRDYFIILQLKNQVPDQILLILILLFNLRYLIPIVCGLFFSIKIGNENKLDNNFLNMLVLIVVYVL